MRFLDLDGNHIDVKISNNILHRKKKFSSLHQEARELLKVKYPLMEIYDDVAISVQKRKVLFIDLFIPSINLAIEVNGKQHYEYTPMFHKSKMDFLRKKHNDELKKEWCMINNINFIELPYNLKKEWKDIINEC